MLRDELDPLERAGHTRQRGLLLRRRGRGGGLNEDRANEVFSKYTQRRADTVYFLTHRGVLSRNGRRPAAVPLVVVAVAVAVRVGVGAGGAVVRVAVRVRVPVGGVPVVVVARGVPATMMKSDLSSYFEDKYEIGSQVLWFKV